MKYRAREVYQDKEIVGTYDIKRFKTPKGWLVDKREKYLISKAVRFVGIIPPALILDVPCGTGRISIYLAKKGFKIKAIDLSREMIIKTMEKIKEQNLEQLVFSESGDAESLQYPDNSFDAVISLRLFGHVPPEIRVKILRELKRVSKGCLILTYCHRDSLQGRLRRRKRIKANIQWYPVSLSEMKEEIGSVDLRVVKILFLAKNISETLIILAKK